MREPSNPLEPKYELQKVDIRPITPPKFIRDQMNIDDIEGAKPKTNWQKHVKTKEVNKIDDIEGTRTRRRHSPRMNSAGYTAEDYSDVYKPSFITKRIADPLNPTYTVRDDENKVITIG